MSTEHEYFRTRISYGMQDYNLSISRSELMHVDMSALEGKVIQWVYQGMTMFHRGKLELAEENARLQAIIHVAARRSDVRHKLVEQMHDREYWPEGFKPRGR